MAKNNLLSFLFLESTEVDAAEGDLADKLERLFEAAAEAEATDLESRKTPLAKALKEFGIEDSDLQLDTEGFVLVTDNRERYADIMRVLGDADAVHKLAEMGWVVTKPGDPAMTNERPEYTVRFLEITTVDQNDREPKGGGYDTKNREEVIKKAQEFATTPMDREDEMNPVENETGKMSRKNVGVGKAKDGEEPEGKPKGSTKKTEESMTELDEFTSTGSMGTAMPMGQPFVGMVNKGAPYEQGKGSKFKTPSQWKVRQPVVKKQVKRKVKSESVDPGEQGAEAFLNEDGPQVLEEAAGCECADPKCPVCQGHCDNRASTNLKRIDMDDKSGTMFCEGCAQDALNSGVFTDNLPGYIAGTKRSAVPPKASWGMPGQHEAPGGPGTGTTIS